MVIYFLWVLVVAGTNAHVLYSKTCDQARQKNINGTSEEDGLTYQSFIKYLYIKLICTKEYPNKYSYHFYSSLSFITSDAATEKRTLIPTVSKIITNRWYKNKRLESNEVVKFLAISSPNCATLQWIRSPQKFWWTITPICLLWALDPMPLPHMAWAHIGYIG